MKTGGSFQFSRRALLKAAGSTLLVPTFLKQAFAQTATPAMPSLICFMQTGGTHQASFWPTGTAYGQMSAGAPTFTSPILSSILTDPTVGPLTTLVNGIYLNKTGNPGGDGHDWGWHGLFSGHDNISSGGDQFGGGQSVDQVLINNLNFTTPFKNIHCGVIAANYQLINAGRASWVCASPGLQVPPQIDIYALYTQVFGSVTTPADAGPASDASTQAAALRLAQQKSVLDVVASDLVTLENRLGPTERAKVDIHLQAVRDFETRLSSTLTSGGATTNPAMCSNVQPSILGVPSTGQGNEANAPTLFTLFMEFIANAIGCNMVQILTFQAGRGGEHFHYAWLNLPGMRPDFHNDIEHADLPSGTDTDAASVMVSVAQYQAQMVFSLAQKLAQFPAANGKTVLDNTLLVYGNEIATGPHGLSPYPIVLIGGAAGQLTTTGVLVNAGTQMHQRLGCTIENIMGMKSAGFGAEPACGVLQGLSLA
ncbi:MAG: DUF1552 domain-containing protein [Polyangiaceae bacterium]|jgi:hypothetical protein